MKLLGEDLSFGNKNQSLIVKRLDEDYNSRAKVSFVKKMSGKTNEQIKLVSDIEELEKQNTKTIDKYIKSLNNIKIRDIIDYIIKPMIDKQKEYYENNFNHVLQLKRSQALEKMKQKYKGRNVVLDF